MDFRVGSFVSPTSPGTVTFDTGLGVACTGLIVFVGPPDSADTFHDDINCGYGFCDADLNQVGIGHYRPWEASINGSPSHSYNAAGLWDPAQGGAQTLIHIVHSRVQVDAGNTPPYTAIVLGNVTAFNSDGTVDVDFTTVADGVARTIGFAAFSGVDSQVDRFNWTDAGDTVVSTPFDPDMVIALSNLPFKGMSVTYTTEYGSWDNSLASHDSSQAIAAGGYAVNPSGNGPSPNGFIADSYGLATDIGLGSGTWDSYATICQTGQYTFHRTGTASDAVASSAWFACMALSFPTDIFAEAVSEDGGNPDPGVGAGRPGAGFVPSSLSATIGMLSATDDNQYVGAFPGPGVNWSAQDAYGNTVDLWIYGRANPSSENKGEIGCAIFTDGRVHELAHGNLVADSYGNGSAAYEYNHMTLDLSDPDNVTRDWDQSTWTFPTAVSPTSYSEDPPGGANFFGGIFIGPLKVPHTFQPQVIRYR